MQHLNELKTILSEVLGLGERANELGNDSILLGNIPEFDSFAVVSLITALEKHFGISIDDNEISAKTFETLGSLAVFIDQKLKDKQTH